MEDEVPSRCLGIGPGDRCEVGDAPVSFGDKENVLGTALELCGVDPMTGWFRDGYCRTDARDTGVHVVCASLTDAFLEYTAARGNDLSTPRPQFGFPGLNAGDRWCLCAARWKEASRDGVAPSVVLEASHASALRTIDLQDLRRHVTPP